LRIFAVNYHKRLNKMRLLHIFWAFLVTTGVLMVSISGCGDPVGTLQGEVIAVHDEAMALMGDISSRERSLRDTMRQVEQTENPDSVQISQLQEAVSQLKAANEAMMDWMRNYTPPAASQSTEASLTYLRGEMEKITAVKQQMLQSLELTQSLSESP
jgi:hypothetical protein